MLDKHKGQHHHSVKCVLFETSCYFHYLHFPLYISPSLFHPDSLLLKSFCSRLFSSSHLTKVISCCVERTGIVMSSLNSAGRGYTNSSPLLNSHNALKQNSGWGKHMKTQWKDCCNLKKILCLTQTWHVCEFYIITITVYYLLLLSEHCWLYKNYPHILLSKTLKLKRGCNKQKNSLIIDVTSFLLVQSS